MFSDGITFVLSNLYYIIPIDDLGIHKTYIMI
jgi:hypothetical protein